MSPILYYDGNCGACDGFVQLVLAKDRERRFRFRPMDGEVTTMRLRLGDRTLERSDAALTVMSLLPYPWRLLGLLRVFPRALRDSAYDAFARVRYRLFGRVTSCRILSAEERLRFL